MALYNYPEDISFTEKLIVFLIKLIGYGCLAFVLYEAASRSFGF